MRQARSIIIMLVILALTLPAMAQTDEIDFIVLESGEAISATFEESITSQIFAFNGLEGDRVSITMQPAENSSIDPFLVLMSPDGAVIASDDDSGGNFAALINGVALPVDGTYLVLASSFEFIDPFAVPDELEAPLEYTLTMTGATGDPDADLELTVADISAGDTIDDTIDEEQPIALYVFSANAGERVSVLVESLNFQTVVQLFDPAGNRIGIDYTTLDDIELTEDGVHLLFVSDVAFYVLGQDEQDAGLSLVQFTGGDYTLSVSGR